MKKVLVTGLLAICVIAISQDQASAWVNKRCGLNLSWSRQSGGNNFGWGLYRNGQPPGPEAFGHGFAPSAYPSYGHSHGFDASSFDMPAPAYAPPSYAYPMPYQFATYPRPEYYYYPMPTYYGR
jgi:hypothetical protein